jgi:hypothetical protein
LVRPGVLLVIASFDRSVRELIKLDLPALERPIKATCGVPSSSIGSSPITPLTNVAEVIFIAES